jgi:protein-tyrosine phosphatase
MIDLHCHLLPAVDDGPPALGAALTLAQAQVRAGVGTVAATPHVSPRFPLDAATVARAVVEIGVALRAAAIPLGVVVGAELDAITALELPDEELAALSLGGSGWLLLETPHADAAPLEEIVSALIRRGHRILLAHPERSPQLQRDPATLDRLVRSGARTQLTAGALDGAFGRTARRTAERIVAEGLAHVVASDAHDVVRRPPRLREPLRRAGLEEAVELLCERHPAAVLAGESLPARVELSRRSSLLRRLGGPRR